MARTKNHLDVPSVIASGYNQIVPPACSSDLLMPGGLNAEDVVGDEWPMLTHDGHVKVTVE